MIVQQFVNKFLEIIRQVQVGYWLKYKTVAWFFCTQFNGLKYCYVTIRM